MIKKSKGYVMKKPPSPLLPDMFYKNRRRALFYRLMRRRSKRKESLLLGLILFLFFFITATGFWILTAKVEGVSIFRPTLSFFPRITSAFWADVIFSLKEFFSFLLTRLLSLLFRIFS